MGHIKGRVRCVMSANFEGKRVSVSVPVSDGSRVNVRGYVLPGTGDTVAVTRPVRDPASGWVVTHIPSGMRMPDVFGTRQDASDAVSVLLARVPDAVGIMGRIASRSQSREDSRRLQEGWQSARDRHRVDPYAAIRAEIRAHFGGSWDESAARVLEDLGDVASGWEYAGDVLTCPCGHTVEDDGRCPSGHVSPFRLAGLI